MNEINAEEVFRRELIYRNYPIDSIYLESLSNVSRPSNSCKIDMIVRRGEVILQAFEIKRVNNCSIRPSEMMSGQLRLIKQSISSFSYDIPVYLVCIDRDNQLTLYDENLNMLKNIENVLDYNIATQKIVNKIDRSIDQFPSLRSIFFMCHGMSFCIVIYLLLYAICEFVSIDRLPITVNGILIFSLALIMMLFPSIVKLQPSFVKIQCWLFSLEAKFNKKCEQK